MGKHYFAPKKLLLHIASTLLLLGALNHIQIHARRGGHRMGRVGRGRGWRGGRRRWYGGRGWRRGRGWGGGGVYVYPGGYYGWPWYGDGYYGGYYGNPGFGISFGF